jgi:hypothetical protein
MTILFCMSGSLDAEEINRIYFLKRLLGRFYMLALHFEKQFLRGSTLDTGRFSDKGTAIPGHVLSVPRG